MRLFIKLISIVMIVCVVVVSFIYINILSHGNNTTPEKSDVILVLGCQIWDTTPSWSLEYRLQKALNLYNEGYGDYIIVSGGQGQNEITPESVVMKAWLVSNGIDNEMIFEESTSSSTFENLKNSKEIMDEKGLKTALIISSDFHMFRAMMLAERLGIDASSAAAPSVEFLRLKDHSREVLSVIKSFLVDR